MAIALTGIAIFVIAVAGGWLIVRRKSSEQDKQVKVLLFGLYFWVLVFVQLLIVAAIYYLW